MSASPAIDEKVAPFLALLVEKIHQQTFTERDIEEVLGWKRQHIDQLKDGIQGLRVAEVIQVLDTIGVEPKAFFAELYGLPSSRAERPDAELARAELAEIARVVESIVDLLVANGALTAGELTRVIATRTTATRAGEP